MIQLKYAIHATYCLLTDYVGSFTEKETSGFTHFFGTTLSRQYINRGLKINSHFFNFWWIFGLLYHFRKLKNVAIEIWSIWAVNTAGNMIFELQSFYKITLTAKLYSYTHTLNEKLIHHTFQDQILCIFKWSIWHFPALSRNNMIVHWACPEKVCKPCTLY